MTWLERYVLKKHVLRSFEFLFIFAMAQRWMYSSFKYARRLEEPIQWLIDIDLLLYQNEF